MNAIENDDFSIFADDYTTLFIQLLCYLHTLWKNTKIMKISQKVAECG